MGIYRFQCSWQMDNSFPRDAQVITPHFSVTEDIGGVDAEALADDLGTALVAWDGVTTQLTIKVYDAQGTPPVYPIAEVVKNQGVFQVSGINRDVALCLSFYGGFNRPRRRGRLYIPCAVAGMSPSGARPAGTNQQRIADLVPILTGLGGINVDWCVFSRLDNQAYSVSHWWVDNAWDTQRRRGLAPTSRLEGDVSE